MTKEDCPEIVLAVAREVLLETHSSLFVSATRRDAVFVPYYLLGRLPVLAVKSVHKPSHLQIEVLRFRLRCLLP